MGRPISVLASSLDSVSMLLLFIRSIVRFKDQQRLKQKSLILEIFKNEKKFIYENCSNPKKYNFKMLKTSKMFKFENIKKLECVKKN
jgi:hypothetical protein